MGRERPEAGPGLAQAVTSRCRHLWTAWLVATVAAFAVGEWRACTCRCHPTLSRALHRWLRCDRNPYLGPALFGAGFCALAAHVALLSEVSGAPTLQSDR